MFINMNYFYYIMVPISLVNSEEPIKLVRYYSLTAQRSRLSCRLYQENRVNSLAASEVVYPELDVILRSESEKSIRISEK